MITWFGQGVQTFPQINFLLVTPAATPELVSFVNENAAGLQMLLDSDGFLGARLGVTRAPTVFLTLDGMHIGRLDWPFSEQDLLAATAELAEFPDPIQLLGQAAPEFNAIDLVGREIALADLPRPLLLSFFDPFCPPCWEGLLALVAASIEVSVSILAFVGEEGLSDQHRARFEEYGVGAGQMVVLLLEEFQVFDAYQVTVTPTTILIDEQGVISEVKRGRIDEQDLRNWVRTIAVRED